MHWRWNWEFWSDSIYVAMLLGLGVYGFFLDGVCFVEMESLVLEPHVFGGKAIFVGGVC